MTTYITNIGLLATPRGDSARRGRQQGEITLLRDAWVAVEGGKIAAVGQGQPAPEDGDTLLDAGGRLMTPGLVDAHTHLIFGGWRQNELGQKLRGVPYLDILAQGGGILSTVRATRAASEEQLAHKAAQIVPEEHVIVLYARALFDDKAYISDEEFRQVLARFGLTEQQALSHYDTVLHLVSCAKGAEFAYNFGNEARYEPLELAREKDDLTLRAWRAHPNLHVIDNSVDFEDKIARGLRAVYEALGRPTQQEVWHKYLIALPTLQTLEQTYHAASIDMMQTYLTRANPSIVRRVRQQKNGGDYLYFYTEKRTTGSGQWETEKPISEKEYIRYLMEGDTSLHTVHKTKYRFVYNGCRFEIDVYPFSQDRAIMRAALPENAPVLTAPPEITVLREVTGDPAYKNRQLAKNQRL